MRGFNISIGSVGKISKSRETQTNKHDFIAYKDIRLNNLYNLGNAIEKNQVLTLLSAIKLNF